MSQMCTQCPELHGDVQISVLSAVKAGFLQGSDAGLTQPWSADRLCIYSIFHFLFLLLLYSLCQDLLQRKHVFLQPLGLTQQLPQHIPGGTDNIQYIIA